MAVAVADGRTRPPCVVERPRSEPGQAAFRGRRQVMHMEWPSGAAVGDAVIVRQEPSSGSRFVVHGSHGPQLACTTYAEAEAQAASYAERARANVWYVEGGRLQLVCSFSNCRLC